MEYNYRPTTHNDLAMQMMVDTTRQLRSDLEQLRKEHRNVVKRMQQFETTLGRVVADGRFAADSTMACQEVRGRRESVDSNESVVDSNYNRYNPNFPVGTVGWIQDVYGTKAQSIMSRLKALGVKESKWPYLFDARFSADRVMSQRLLDARFSDNELSKFCMSRPNQTRPKDEFRQPLKSSDGSLMAPTKSLLPNQKEMLGTLLLLQLHLLFNFFSFSCRTSCHDGIW
jgi:hypothetical protein